MLQGLRHFCPLRTVVISLLPVGVRWDWHNGRITSWHKRLSVPSQSTPDSTPDILPNFQADGRQQDSPDIS